MKIALPKWSTIKEKIKRPERTSTLALIIACVDKAITEANLATISSLQKVITKQNTHARNICDLRKDLKSTAMALETEINDKVEAERKISNKIVEVEKDIIRIEKKQNKITNLHSDIMVLTQQAKDAELTFKQLTKEMMKHKRGQDEVINSLCQKIEMLNDKILQIMPDVN